MSKLMPTQTGQSRHDQTKLTATCKPSYLDKTAHKQYFHHSKVNKTKPLPCMGLNQGDPTEMVTGSKQLSLNHFM